MSRRPNPRLIKIHHSYTVEELAAALRVHKNTVRNWIKGGLPIIDGGRPALVHGADARAFLYARRVTSKQPCAPGELYCVHCRSPKSPAAGIADYIPLTPSSGNLRRICPECESLIHRRVALARLDTVRGELEVAFPQGRQRIRECE